MSDNNERGKSLPYRGDIDGLRAIAVVLVVANHLRTRALGGYIGVDVFFVISGYLISSVILSEMSAGTFSLMGFYERRIRRIFPALLALLTAVTVVAYLYYVPSEIEAYCYSLLAALFSVSNMLFWQEAGYFDAPSALKPLLHTWSLGVEEQFYIFFPLFIFVVRRWWPAWLKHSIWLAASISFLLACWWVRHDPTAAFFFAPLRAWELLLGTILSQSYLVPIRGKVGRNVASTLGLLLILIPAFAYSQLTVFPGLAALPPCLGAGLIIAAGETGSSLVGRILSWRPVVFVGLISYSLYLWHWPILAFENVVPLFTKMSTHSKSGKSLFLVVSISIATLSWRFIETPFRKGQFRPERRTLFVLTGSAVLGLVCCGLGLLAVHGIPLGFPREAVPLIKYTHYQWGKEWRQNECFFAPGTDFSELKPSVCLPDEPARKQFLLIGDSHAADLYPGLSTVFPDVNILQANATYCPPLVTEPALRPEFKPNCTKLSHYIYGDYLLHHHVDTVLLSAFWEEPQLPELGRTVAWIQQHGMKVVVFGPSLEYTLPLPRVLIAALRDRKPGQIAIREQTGARQLDAEMAQMARHVWKVPYISVFETLCTPHSESLLKVEAATQHTCPVYAGPGIPILFDTNHFTSEGSILYAKAVRDQNLLPH